MSPSPEQSGAKARKLRSACDACHRSKTRCSGGVPCDRCKVYLTPCRYSVSVRTGKPKGSKCRKTIEREQRAAAAAAAEAAEYEVPASNDTTLTDSSSPRAGGTPASSLPPSPPPSSSSAAPGLGCAASTFAETPMLEPTSSTIPHDWLISAPQDTSDPWLSLDAVPWASLPGYESLGATTTEATALDAPWVTAQDAIPNCIPTPPTSSWRTNLHPNPCNCLATLAGLAGRDPSTIIAACQYDMMLVLVRDFCNACCSFARCPSCPKDLGSISLTLITLRILASSLKSVTTHLVHTSRSRTTGPCIPSAAANSNPNSNSTEFTDYIVPPPGCSTKPCIPFQLGLYQNQEPGEDEEEKTLVLGALIQSSVRRLLGVCWPIWELLRGVQKKSVPEGLGEGGETAMGMGIAPAEFAGLIRGLIQSQNRLCAMLTD